MLNSISKKQFKVFLIYTYNEFIDINSRKLDISKNTDVYKLAYKDIIFILEQDNIIFDKSKIEVWDYGDDKWIQMKKDFQINISIEEINICIRLKNTSQNYQVLQEDL